MFNSLDPCFVGTYTFLARGNFFEVKLLPETLGDGF